MSAVLSAFGIDWRLLLVNSINFGFLLLALWYFLYGPLMRVLEERQQKVAKGVHDAERANRKLLEVQESRVQILAEAGKEADEVLHKARATAQEKEKQIVAASEVVAASRIKDAEAQAQELKAQAMLESKQEVAKLVVLGIEKMQAGGAK